MVFFLMEKLLFPLAVVFDELDGGTNWHDVTGFPIFSASVGNSVDCWVKG